MIKNNQQQNYAQFPLITVDARVHHHPKANLEATSQLKKRDDIIITQPDKGSALGCLKGGELQSVH